MAFFCEKDFIIFNALFMKSNAHIQFISILQKRHFSIIAGVYRKNAKYLALEIKILNRKNDI